MKPKVVTWLIFLMALFMGSIGSLDVVCCLESCEFRNPQEVPFSQPESPAPPSPCAGCSDSPAIFVGHRSGHCRVLGATLYNPQEASGDSFNNSLIPLFGHVGCPSRYAQSHVLNPFSLPQTVVLLI